MDPVTMLAIGTPVVAAGALAVRPLQRWVRKVRRRKGGVYLYRVRHHRNPLRRVNGYVGESVNFRLRDKQHHGLSRFDPASGRAVARGLVKVPSQPWSDLDPVMHRVIPLPWWLCWKWVLRPLETLVMLLTWPVYNDAKNHWNPRRITKSLARMQRAARDAGGSWAASARVAGGRAARLVLQVAGVLVLLIGLAGWAMTR